MKRRDFFKMSALVSSSLYLPSWLNPEAKGPLAVKVTGESPYDITRQAVAALGGMEKFVSNDDIVMVKPNIGWNRTIEQAANTNPDVVRAVVEMAYKAGAKKVIVMDHPCNRPFKNTYQRSGIEEAAKKAGAEVRFVDNNKLTGYDFKGSRVKTWPVFRDFLKVNKFINLPILKHHSSAVLTIGMKNLYGILGGNRGKLHRNMGASIADLSAGFKVDLTIVDAYRVLVRNGPNAGTPKDVELKKTVIATTNIMEADVIATHLFGKSPQEIPFLVEGFKRKIGQIDIKKINLKTIPDNPLS